MPISSFRPQQLADQLTASPGALPTPPLYLALPAHPHANLLVHQPVLCSTYEHPANRPQSRDQESLCMKTFVHKDSDFSPRPRPRSCLLPPLESRPDPSSLGSFVSVGYSNTAHWGSAF